MPQHSQISQFNQNKFKTLTLMDGFHGNQKAATNIMFLCQAHY